MSAVNETRVDDLIEKIIRFGSVWEPCGIISLVTVMRARFVFSTNSRLSVRASHDCDKHEKRQVGGFLIRGTMKWRIKKILEAASELSSLGFTIFDSDRFAEFYVAELIGGKTTHRNCPYDCILEDGTRIEIKSSKLIEGKTKAFTFQYFHWGDFFGHKNNKVGKVDTLLLYGKSKNFVYFWVIPYSEIKHHKVEWQVTPERKTKSYSWIDPYYVGHEEDLMRYFEDGRHRR